MYGFVPEGVGRMANVRGGMVGGVCVEAEGSGYVIVAYGRDSLFGLAI